MTLEICCGVRLYLAAISVLLMPAELSNTASLCQSSHRFGIHFVSLAFLGIVAVIVFIFPCSITAASQLEGLESPSPASPDVPLAGRGALARCARCRAISAGASALNARWSSLFGLIGRSRSRQRRVGKLKLARNCTDLIPE